VHELFVAIDPPERLMLVLPAVAVAVPPHAFESPLGVETTRPVGSVSVNATPSSPTVLAGAFVIVNVSVVVPFRGMPVGLNALAMLGGATTKMEAVLLVVPVPPSVEVMAPVVLLSVPALIPRTFTENVHEPEKTRVAPERLTLLEPAVAVIVPPPQLPVSPFGVATWRPAGRLSVKPIPDKDVVVFGLFTVNDSDVVLPSGIDPAPNDFVTVGGPATVMVAFEVFPVPPSVEVTWTRLLLIPAVVP
jgi:hypothetical protein